MLLLCEDTIVGNSAFSSHRHIERGATFFDIAVRRSRTKGLACSPTALLHLELQLLVDVAHIRMSDLVQKLATDRLPGAWNIGTFGFHARCESFLPAELSTPTLTGVPPNARRHEIAR